MQSQTECSAYFRLKKSNSREDLSFFSSSGSCPSAAVPFQEVELEHYEIAKVSILAERDKSLIRSVFHLGKLEILYLIEFQSHAKLHLNI